MRKNFTFLPLWACLALSIPVTEQNLALNLTGSNDVQGDAEQEVISSTGNFTVEFCWRPHQTTEKPKTDAQANANQ